MISRGDRVGENSKSEKRDDSSEYVGFIYRFTKYCLNNTTKVFYPIEFDYYMTYASIIDTYSQGMTEGEEYENSLKLYGMCSIKIPKRSILHTLFTHILNPFYIFQLYAVILWASTNYYIYATCIFVITVIIAIWDLVQIQINLSNIRKLAYYSCNITVRRKDANGDFFDRQINSDDLVPGDIVIVPERTKMP